MQKPTGYDDEKIKTTKRYPKTKKATIWFKKKKKRKFPRFPSFQFCSLPKIENSEISEISLLPNSDRS